MKGSVERSSSEFCFRAPGKSGGHASEVTGVGVCCPAKFKELDLLLCKGQTALHSSSLRAHEEREKGSAEIVQGLASSLLVHPSTLETHCAWQSKLGIRPISKAESGIDKTGTTIITTLLVVDEYTKRKRTVEDCNGKDSRRFSNQENISEEGYKCSNVWILWLKGYRGRHRHCYCVTESREKRKRVLWNLKKKRLLVLSVTPAGSYHSVFKPTGLPWTALLNSRFSNRKQWRSEVA